MFPRDRLVIHSLRNANRRQSARYLDGHYAHHLRSKECTRTPPNARLLDDAYVFGVNLNDFGMNGLLLTSNEAAAKASGLPLHLGSHLRHSRFVIDQTFNIADQTRRLNARFNLRFSHIRLTACARSYAKQSSLALVSPSFAPATKCHCMA